MPASDAPVRVLHLIPHLGQGGAEAALAGLVSIPQPGISHAICTMLDVPQHFRPQVPVLTAPISNRLGSAALVPHLRRALREVRPQILHCWMYHANLLSVAALGSGVRILWSIHGHAPGECTKFVTRQVSAACALLSPLVPKRILYCAETARQRHELAGYAPNLSAVVPNGVDLLRFRPPPRRSTTGSLRLGMVARYDPKVKGHHLLVDTLACHPLRDTVELTFAGAGCDTAAPLRQHLARVGLLERTTLLGAVPDIERVYAGLDVLILPSMTEALPMVVLEAAASGLVVCASRVGDVPRLGLPDDVLFEPGDASGLSRALNAAAARTRRPGEAERQRALAEGFGIAASARSHAALYRAMLI